MIAFLKQNGFPTSPYLEKASTFEAIDKAVGEIESRRETLDYLIDGAVVKVISLATREAMG